ncbi:MAG: hypothetical protein ACRYGH_19835 [Janthinobacterium lividum]
MRHFLLLGIGLALASCASHKQLVQPAPSAHATSHSELPLDSIVVARQPNLFDKLLRRSAQTDTHVGQLPTKIGKKSTVAYYYGPATVTNAAKKAQVAAGADAALTITGKRSGPVIWADSGAQVATSGQGIAQTGQGNTAIMPAEKPKKSLFKSLVTGLAHHWIAVVVGLVAVGLLWTFWPTLGPLLVALWARRKKTDS